MILDLGDQEIDDEQLQTKLGKLKPAEFQDYTALILENNPITDLSPLKPFSRLRVINLMDTNITDLTPISESSFVSTLEELYLSDTAIKDISCLSRFSNLRVLYMTSTLVADLTPLKDLDKLEELSVADTAIEDKDIGVLCSLPLRQLDISNVDIYATALLQLKSCKYLKKLDVDYELELTAKDIIRTIAQRDFLFATRTKNNFLRF